MLANMERNALRRFQTNLNHDSAHMDAEGHSCVAVVILARKRQNAGLTRGKSKPHSETPRSFIPR